MKRILRLCFATILLIAATATWAINGSFDNGFSAITRGMAGSGAALPQDSLIAAINPAGMVFVGKRVDAGAAIYFPHMSIYTSGGTPCPRCIILPKGHFSDAMRLMVLPDAGVNWMINKVSSFGLSLYSLGGFGATYITNQMASLPFGGSGPGLLGFGSVRDRFREAGFNATYSHKVTKNSSWGVSLVMITESYKAEGLGALAPLTATFNKPGGGLPTNLTNRGTDYSFGVGLRAAIMAKIFHRLSIALSYQPVVFMSKLTKYSDLFPNGGELDIPANGIIGFALHINPKAVFTLDILKIWYDTVPAYGRGDQALLPGGQCSMANPQACLGGQFGPGFGWKNLTAVKVGFQFEAPLGWVWRFGFNHSNLVLSRTQMVENLLAPGSVFQDLFAVGLTRKLSKKNHVHLFVIYVPEQHVTGPNSFSAGTQTIKMRSGGLGFGFGWTWFLT